MNSRSGVHIIAILTLSLLLLLAISPTINSAPPITPETLIVDINGNGDFRTIGAAINSADPTDIIFIRSGTYSESNLAISKKIELTGENPSTTIIDCSGNTAFTISSSYVEINNLQIINTGDIAIVIESGSTGCSISNCIINTDYPGTAIDVRSSYNIITNCSLDGSDTSRQGVKIHGANNIVSNCVIEDFSNGVLVLIGSNNNQVKNCNIINNENAIDFRIGSNENIVTGCNILSNLQSIKIWQDSNDNLVYLNNFEKNDIDAIDEGSNVWDNGEQGNYWDRYQGADSNNDGIGDTPYEIAEGIQDRYPLMEMALPDIVTQPSDVEVVSSKSDTTPTFIWAASTYSKGIKGYYVKIDNNQEELVDTTSWASTKVLTEGTHTFYLRAVSVDDKTSTYSTLIFTIDTSIIDTDGDGWPDEDEQQYGTDPNNPDNYPIDTDNDHIPNIVDTDDDNDGYSDEMELSYGTAIDNRNSYPTDTDSDGIPNNDSPDGKFKGDEDDDNDGLTDSIENSIGSNPTNALDAVRFYISGKPYYLVDLSQNGIYDILYNPTSKAISGVEKQNENYLIDSNNNGNWDHVYDTSNGSVTSIEEEFALPIWAIFILILVPILLIIYYYNRKKPIRFKEYRETRRPERYVEKPLFEKLPIEKRISEKPLKFYAGEKKETVEMIDQTMTVLQHIQNDVELYMKQLRRIEKQFIEPEEAPKKETKQTEEDISRDEDEPGVIVDIRDIESKVDKLLDSLDDKDEE